MTPESKPRPSAPTAGSQIDLFVFSLDLEEDELAALGAHLSPEEDQRGRRFVEDRDRRRYVAARGRLRDILSSYAGTPPGELEFSYGDRGKPYLASARKPFFNLTHSAHLAALAVSPRFEIGVDIERLREVRRDLPKRYFSAAEVSALDALEGAAWQAAFFRCWTRKEAFIKALGEGMHQPLKSFSVSFAEAEPARLDWLEGDAAAPSNWTLLDFTPAAGFAGAIAVMTGGAAAPGLRIVSSVPAIGD